MLRPWLHVHWCMLICGENKVTLTCNKIVPQISPARSQQLS